MCLWGWQLIGLYIFEHTHSYRVCHLSLIFFIGQLSALFGIGEEAAFDYHRRHLGMIEDVDVGTCRL